MELHIKDRIYIPQLLPQSNSFMGFNLKREITKKVALTAEDQETYKIKEEQEHNRVVWDVEKDRELPLIVDFTKDELNYLKTACEKLAEAPYPDDFWLTVEKIYNAANAE